MPSPLMEQYARIKAQHPGEILLFHLGDFYEMFYEDAQRASQILGIVLTSRQKGEGRVPMCGIPVHSSASYINRLLRGGCRVAICEQLEEAEEAKGLVERGVTRVITSGTLIDETLLEEKKHNHLAALVWKETLAGLAWADLSTGLFRTLELPLTEVEDELSRLQPSELLIPSTRAESEDPRTLRLRELGSPVTPAPDWTFDFETAHRDLCEHFGTKNLAGFDCDDLPLGVAAAGALLAYLKHTQKSAPRQLTRLVRHVREGRVFLDRQTVKSLELTETMRSGTPEGSLLSVIDRTVTPMGGRMLRDWITAPLRDRSAIEQRFDAVGELLTKGDVLRERLQGFGDLERLLSKVASARATPRDLGMLRDSLHRLPELAREKFTAPLLGETTAQLGNHSTLLQDLTRALVEEPPALLTEGGIFRSGHDPELDRLRDIASGGRTWLGEYETREIERTGIPSLKVGFNNIFGYYIEITHVHAGKVPPDYTRKQTLKNAERYITPALKEFETEVLRSDEQAKRLEKDLFVKLRERVATDMESLQRTATAVACLDTLLSMASVARESDYVRPLLDDSDVLDIEQGRHPVLDRTARERFIPNDVTVGGAATLLLITGPNMAGKSTYIRQTALLTLMAQMGSFVPARRMRLGVVDRIFTRIGAADELTRGASTFMVEMNETANILNHATSKSLVILDEIGRGTSTFDGVAIAWAVSEDLHDRIGCRTLFATHYHELTELSGVLKGIRNLHVAVREWGESIVFLHQIVEGATDKSYGIHVARIAGIPVNVVERAKVIMAGLEALTIGQGERPKMAKKPAPGDLQQLSLFAGAVSKQAPDLLRSELAGLEPDRLTPLEALQKLSDLKRRFTPPK